MRAAIEASRDSMNRARAKAELRSKIVDYAQVQKKLGKRMGEVAAELGVPKSTLYGWKKTAAKVARKKMLPMKVRKSAAPIDVHGPSGFRIDGLGLPRRSKTEPVVA